MSTNSKKTIRDAEDAIRRRFAKDGFAGVLEYDHGKVIETDRWWYIPFCWIGCFGFIVNKDDLYANWLGSTSSPNLDQCFWGHDHGLFCDLVDFTFSSDTDTELAKRLLPKFKHTRPNESGVPPAESVWYNKSEIESKFLIHFPTFKRHFVWFAIAELRHAYENDGLRFTCSLSKGT